MTSFARPDKTTTRFDADPERSFTLPASYYTDPDVLAAEQSAIFWRSWMWIGHVSQVAANGDYLTSDVAGQRVFAIRTAAGELKAFFNVCMHRGHALLEGAGTVTNRITCPYHAWAYDTDGHLKGARMADRMADFDYTEFQLPEVAIEEFCGFLFVNLSPEPTPMSQVYPGAEDAIRSFVPQPEDLAPADVSTFVINGNWKNVGDNLLECYHCHPAHPAFVDLINMETYRNDTFENWSLQSGSSRATNEVYAVGDDDGFESLFMWPNVSIGRLPGIDGTFVFQFSPTGAEQTLQTLTVYSRDGEMGASSESAFAYFNEVLGPEDVALVESVQVGLRSLGYHQGRFICIPDRPEISEHAVHHFHSMVLNALGEG